MKRKPLNIPKLIVKITCYLLILISLQSQAKDATDLSPFNCYNNPATMRYELYDDVDLYAAPLNTYVGEVFIDFHIQCAMESATSSIFLAVERQSAQGAFGTPSAIGAQELTLVGAYPGSEHTEIVDKKWYRPSYQTWYVDQFESVRTFYIKKVRDISPNERYPNYVSPYGWAFTGVVGLQNCTSCRKTIFSAPGVPLYEFVAVDKSCEITHPSQIPLPAMVKGQSIQANFNISVNCESTIIKNNLEFSFDVIAPNTQYSVDYMTSLHSGPDLPSVLMSLEHDGSPVKFGESIILNVDQSGSYQQENFTAYFESIDGVGEFSYTVSVWVSYN